MADADQRHAASACRGASHAFAGLTRAALWRRKAPFFGGWVAALVIHCLAHRVGHDAPCEHLAAQDGDVLDHDGQAITERDSVTRAHTDDAQLVFRDLVLVGAHALVLDQHVHERCIERHVRAAADERTDHAFAGLADVIAHQQTAIQIDDLALHVHGGAFAHAGRSRALSEQLDRRLARDRLAAAQQVLHCAVHLHVGITPNRRGKVQVFRGRKPEVPDVLHVVSGLLERAQQEHFQDRLARVRGDALQELGYAERLRHLAGVELDAQLLGHSAEARQLLRVRLAVDAVDGRGLLLTEPARDELVREQHQLLDHVVGALDARIGGAARDVDRRLRDRIERELGLWQIQIQGAALHARLAQLLGQLLHHAELFFVCFGGRALRRKLGKAERTGHAAVSEHRGRAHHAFDDLELLHLAVAIQIRDHAQAQAVLFGEQRAEVGRESGGQHRDRAIRQVNRAAAAQCFFVELAAWLHVLAHVGNRDPGAEAVTALFDPHRVVVVARILRIDRGERDRAQVDAALHVQRQEPHGHGFCLADRAFGVLLGDLLTDQDLGDLDVRIARGAQDRDQLAFWVFVAKIWEFGDFGHGGVAVLAHLHGVGEHDRTAQARVVWLEPRALAAAAQHARHARVAARHDELDAALDAARGAIHDRDLHLVAVQSGADRFGGDVRVVVADGVDETEAALVDAEHALPALGLLNLAQFRGIALPAEAFDAALVG